jgi:GTPase SAR1 family protein
MGCSASKPTDPGKQELPPAPKPKVATPPPKVEEPKPEPAPAPEPEPKVEEPTPEPEPVPEEPKPEPVPEEPKPEPVPEPTPEPVPEEPKPEPVPEPKPNTKEPMVVAVEGDVGNNAFGLLLCGAGESGKTTFTRQLKLRFLGEFSETERVDFLRTIRGNVVDCILSLISWLQSHEIEIEDEEAQNAAAEIVEVDPYTVTFDEELVEKLKLLWENETIKDAFKHVDETPIPDHMPYFFEKIDELVSEEYIPTNEDVLKARIRTVGIDQITFNLEGAIIRIFDVGGQKNERSKWSNVMDQVEGVIYCVSFADFDRQMFEDPNTIRINDALDIFDNITHQEKFQNSPIFLVCNKFDVFAKKIRETDAFIQIFPEYQGDEHDPDACAQYLIDKFMEKAAPLSEERPIKQFKIVALNSDDVVNTANDICKFISDKYYAE